jgi:hypothetical protein
MHPGPLTPRGAMMNPPFPLITLIEAFLIPGAVYLYASAYQKQRLGAREGRGGGTPGSGFVQRGRAKVRLFMGVLLEPK